MKVIKRLPILLTVLMLSACASVSEDSFERDDFKGFVKEYSLVLNDFDAGLQMDVEQYLADFSGYRHHRPVDCSRRHCEYWYGSTLSSARLQRNIHRMLDALGVEAAVVFSGNTFEITRIHSGERRGPRFGSGW
ncbi:MAG: hypothetical protein ABW168_17950 [Sedimenticola sp.]